MCAVKGTPLDRCGAGVKDYFTPNESGAGAKLATPMERRTVFFVSDQTGVTAETMGHSLLTQFDGQAFRQVTLPFISTIEKAEEAVRRINATGAAEGVRFGCFRTIVEADMREIIQRGNG